MAQSRLISAPVQIQPHFPNLRPIKMGLSKLKVSSEYAWTGGRMSTNYLFQVWNKGPTGSILSGDCGPTFWSDWSGVGLPLRTASAGLSECFRLSQVL
jgi:hypothetical protein